MSYDNDASRGGTAPHPFRTLVTDLVRPVRHDLDPARRRLLVARQVVVLAGAAMTLVQVIVWLMIAILGGGLREPWWLWTAIPVVLAAGVLTGIDRCLPDRGE
ncbi:hypothetical protein ACFWY9_34735 [Amycolatopsis sp. NPDC059027]|uniref:hypothetical protein n=1 Tax=unclassified Amycolatopsis TaxID=2618356 RepID=UPI00366DEF9B